MEEDPAGQERSGTRGIEEDKGVPEQRWKEQWNEWQRSRTSSSLSSILYTHYCVIFFLQFQYNPEWFQDDEDGDASDDWDLKQILTLWTDRQNPFNFLATWPTSIAAPFIQI